MPVTPIHHVSDTAIWVAYFRVKETARRDALFRDPLASRLVGERGERIASAMPGSAFTHWTIAIRTVIIDEYIQAAIAKGLTTIINLGAGLDTRPYRLALPHSVQWIEADYAPVIDFKERALRGEEPVCRLERVRIDLTDRVARNRQFAEWNEKGGLTLVLTEGVLPYLSNDEVGTLARDLRSYAAFRYWIVDFISATAVKRMQKGRFGKHLRHSPFRFLVENWNGFFADAGWSVEEMRYLAHEAERMGRPRPDVWWLRPLSFLISKKRRESYKRMSGYALLEPKG